MGKGANAEKVVREIHRRTRRRFSADMMVGGAIRIDTGSGLDVVTR